MALKGVRVVEMAGLAAAPFTSMILADFGASVIRVDNHPDAVVYPDVSCRGKKSISLNLKSSKGRSIVKKLVNNSDVFLESFRPGVMEKLQLCPDVLTVSTYPGIETIEYGYGQEHNPLTYRAGHDINYISLSGALSKIGRVNEKPVPPINIVGDFGGGGLTCAFGIIAALYERSVNSSGKGQIIDCGITQGASYLSTWLYQSKNIPHLWGNPRGENVLDTGAHFYEVYETKEPGKYISVGTVEPQFYSILLDKLELYPHEEYPQFGGDTKKLKDIFASKFRTKTRKEWEEIFSNVDACVTPVLSIDEVSSNELTKNNFHISNSGESVPLPAPKLSRTPAQISTIEPLRIGEHSIEILRNTLGFTKGEIDNLISEEIIFE
ncbi:alpha-methylacyl-CoA racemase isoform X2 [Lepeophtheirus salmonis]|uniref:alpha-methylacyl-CoA racemase isoform X2 n=1 Tax=Lepeophtheirus salmonis TaxID=72036 RepID=UPI001AE4C256|nr:alpha-methylacyl-CoA racemase-like isoform X2 [Lepeophtheirus salmonis]